MSLTARPDGGAIKWLLIALMVVALFVLVRVLPVEEETRRLGEWLDALGIWGPATYGLIYVFATLLLVPGSVLTIAAGAFFGLLRGTVTVSLASTAGAALAFLVARYVARDAVARKVRRHPGFDAVDQAIGQGGWRIVALLRLSPAVPFNLQDYLYGLTALRFWPTVITSWLAMLPGTFMYVYLGYVSRQGLEAAGTQGSLDVGRWALMIVGLAATVAATIYITRLARRRYQSLLADADV